MRIVFALGCLMKKYLCENSILLDLISPENFLRSGSLEGGRALLANIRLLSATSLLSRSIISINSPRPLKTLWLIERRLQESLAKRPRALRES